MKCLTIIRKLILLFILIVLCQSIFAKNDTTKIIKGVNISILRSIWYPQLNPTFSLNYNKSSFSIGPIFGQKQYYIPGADWFREKGTIKLNGILGSYQYNPKFKSKIFDLIFEYNIIYQKFISKDLDEYEYWVFNQVIKNTLLQTIGYKIKIKIYKGIYINQNLGIGINNISRIYINEFTLVYYKKNWTTLDFLFKIGIGYDFKIN